jgi:hypothetical protein
MQRHERLNVHLSLDLLPRNLVLLFAAVALGFATNLSRHAANTVASPAPAATPQRLPQGVIDRNGKGDDHGLDKEVVIEESGRARFVLVNAYDFVKPDNVNYFLVFRPW